MVELQALDAVHGGRAYGVVVLFVVCCAAAEYGAVEAAVAQCFCCGVAFGGGSGRYAGGAEWFAVFGRFADAG